MRIRMTDGTAHDVTLAEPAVGVIVQAERYGVPVVQLDPSLKSLEGQAFILFLGWWALGRPGGDYWRWVEDVAQIEETPEDGKGTDPDPTGPDS